jgi:hypothetical protein
MGKTTLVKPTSMMQPFLPGSPGGRGKSGDGEAKQIEDWRWKQAFPDCKHNKWLNEYNQEGEEVLIGKIDTPEQKTLKQNNA